jgi:hypothetical protein
MIVILSISGNNMKTMTTHQILLESTQLAPLEYPHVNGPNYLSWTTMVRSFSLVKLIGTQSPTHSVFSTIFRLAASADHRHRHLHLPPEAISIGMP